MRNRGENGRFLPGNKASPGRPRGSRNRFAEQFVDDLADEWTERGVQALKELSGPDLVKAAIAVLPKDVLVSMQDQRESWVINAQPNLSLEEWAEKHGVSYQGQPERLESNKSG